MTPGSGLVAWIAIAPVKAMALVQLDEARLESTGIRGDRAFAVVDDQLRLVNGKRLGALASIRPDHDPKTSALTLRFPDGGTVTDTVEMGDPAEAVFFGRPRSVRLVGGPWSEALSDWAGRELRLVALVGDGAGIDRGPSVSLLSAAALGVLAAAGGGVPSLDARRFRMTFGIEGIEPFAEDAWLGRRVRVGDALARPVDHVGRCAVTTQDPDTGIPDFPTLTVLSVCGATSRAKTRTAVWRLGRGGRGRPRPAGRPVGPVEAVTRASASCEGRSRGDSRRISAATERSRSEPAAKPSITPSKSTASRFWLSLRLASMAVIGELETHDGLRVGGDVAIRRVVDGPGVGACGLVAIHEHPQMIEQPRLLVMHGQRASDLDRDVVPGGYVLAGPALGLVPAGRDVGVRAVEERESVDTGGDVAPLGVGTREVATQHPVRLHGRVEHHGQDGRHETVPRQRHERDRDLPGETCQLGRRIGDHEALVRRLVEHAQARRGASATSCRHVWVGRQSRSLRAAAVENRLPVPTMSSGPGPREHLSEQVRRRPLHHRVGVGDDVAPGTAEGCLQRQAARDAASRRSM